MNKLKLSLTKKIFESPKYKPVFDSIHKLSIEVVFVNFGADPNGSGNIYGFYFPLSTDSRVIEVKCGTSENNNSLKIFFAKETDTESIPTTAEKIFKETLEIEIAPPFDKSRPDRYFFPLLDILDALPVTQSMTKAEKDKEVMLWEKYIKAVKAIFKNQEEIFKISKVGELHKDSIEFSIQRENWRAIMIEELEEKFPQYPILNDGINLLEFAIDNTINSIVESQDAEALNVEKLKEELTEVISDNFFKVDSKPRFTAKSHLKLNFFNTDERKIVAEEIEIELLEKFTVNTMFSENWVAKMKLEDVPCLKSIIDKDYQTVELSPVEAIIEIKNNAPLVSENEKSEQLLKEIKLQFANANCNLIDNNSVLEINIMSRFDVFQFQEEYNLTLKSVKQIFTVTNSGKLETFDGAVLNGNSYSIEGRNMKSILPIIGKIREKYNDTRKTSFKTSYYFEIPFKVDTKFIDKERQVKLYQNNIDFNSEHTELKISFFSKEEYQEKIDLIKSVLAGLNVILTEPDTFNIQIRQSLENPDQLNALIDKAVRKPLLNQFGSTVNVEYEIERQIINIEWSGDNKPFDIIHSLQGILSNSDYKHFFQTDFKPEIAQVLSIEISEDTSKLNNFYSKREKTFTDKGSLFLLNLEQVSRFEETRNLFSDEDIGVNIGSIESWKGNRITASLNTKALAKIKSSENPFNFLKGDIDQTNNPEDWVGMFLKPTLSGDLTQYRRLSYAIERIIYPTQHWRRSRKNRLPLFNERLPNFIFDSSTARPITIPDEPLTPLNKLNDKQMEAVRKAINTKDLFILQGPPGTGKTTVISEIIFQILKREPKSKILLTSQTHLAVDNALERLANQSIVKPLRLGTNPDSFEEEGQKYFEGYINIWADAEPDSPTEKKYEKNPVKVWIKNIIANVPSTDEKFKQVLDKWKSGLLKLDKIEKGLFAKRYTSSFNVVGATCSLTGSDFGFLNKYDFLKNGFDYVIFDEASKATPPELLIPLLSGKSIIVIGDHKQLPPMIDENDFEEKLKEIGENELAEEIHEIELGKSHFEKLFRSSFSANPTIITTLDTQYRMHKNIMEVIDQFYQEEGGLKCGLPDNKIDIPDLTEKASRWHGLKYKDGTFLSEDHHVLWVNVDDFEKRVGTSFTNQGEVSAINKILKLIKNSNGFKNLSNYSSKEDDKEIGLITFYGEQKKLLRKMAKDNHSDIPVRINTVDKFQGMERNIIIVSTVRNNKEGNIGFAEKLQRINVAFSRPRRLLIIVGNIDHFAFNKKNVPFYSRIKSIVENQHGKRDKSQLDNI